MKTNTKGRMAAPRNERHPHQDRSPRPAPHYEALWECERQAGESAPEEQVYQRWPVAHD